MKIIKKIKLLKKIGIPFAEIERKIGITKNSLVVKIKNEKHFKKEIHEKLDKYFIYLINKLEKGK